MCQVAVATMYTTTAPSWVYTCLFLSTIHQLEILSTGQNYYKSHLLLCCCCITLPSDLTQLGFFIDIQWQQVTSFCHSSENVSYSSSLFGQKHIPNMHGIALASCNMAMFCFDTCKIGGSEPQYKCSTNVQLHTSHWCVIMRVWPVHLATVWLSRAP